MANLAGELWRFNLAKVVVVDVSDDYELMRPAMPKECYPVIREMLLPRYGLRHQFARLPMAEGFLYDWHESPTSEDGEWFVGVVHRGLLA